MTISSLRSIIKLKKLEKKNYGRVGIAFHHLILILIHERVKACNISSNDNDKN